MILHPAVFPTPGPSSSVPPKPERRPRLKGAGVQILEDFTKTHGFGVEPDRLQRRELLRQIQQIPEYHDYTMNKLMVWFSRRKKEAQARMEGAAQASSSTHPSLNLETVTSLQILYKGAANSPTEDLIKTWAKLLGVPTEEVKCWIKAQQSPPSPPPGSSSWQPLTPRPTLSPEPTTPIDGFDELDKTDSPYSPVVPLATPPQTHLVPGPGPATCSIQNSSEEAVRHMLLLAIAETDAPLAPPSRLPSSGQEFNAMFSPYLDTIRSLEAVLDKCLPTA